MLTERTNGSKLALDTALSRTSCFYSLSFRDDATHEGRRRSVEVLLKKRRGLQVFYPEAYVFRTEAMKTESRLLAAFVDPERADDRSLRAFLIPRSGDGKTWNVAVQLRLRPSGLGDNSAELGASIVRNNAVTDHFSISVATKSGSRPIVLERTLSVAPGDFSIVAVANEMEGDHVGSGHLDERWPDPRVSAAAITPIAVLQTGKATMSREGVFVSSGPLAKADDELLDPSIDIALASVVCRGDQTKGPVQVERRLEGDYQARFETITIDEGSEPCHATRDVVPAGRLNAGVVEYRVVARIGGEIVSEQRRTLRVGATP